MTIMTAHAAGSHGAPLALGDLSRMALITGLLKGPVRRKKRAALVVQQQAVKPVHDPGKRRIPDLIALGAGARQIQGRGIMAPGT
jgi:hypothetical protein